MRNLVLRKDNVRSVDCTSLLNEADNSFPKSVRIGHNSSQHIVGIQSLICAHRANIPNPHPSRASHQSFPQRSFAIALYAPSSAPRLPPLLFAFLSMTARAAFVGSDASIFSRRNGDSNDLCTSVHNPTYVICMQFLLRILETSDGKGIQCLCWLHTRYDDGIIPFR